jgi:hypothetical protein
MLIGMETLNGLGEHATNGLAKRLRKPTAMV